MKISKWTKPHYGVSHITITNKNKITIQGTIIDWEEFCTYFIFSWITHRVVEQGKFLSINYGENYLQECKNYIEGVL